MEPLTLNLWPEKEKASEGKPTENKILNGDDYRLTDVIIPSIALYPVESENPTPAVLVCPGGGYSILAYKKEGTELAEWFNSIGITAILLKYTVPKNRDAAFQDIQRAMRIIRNKAQEWNIDSERIGVMGFSAGAHLSARLCNNFSEKTYSQIDDADSKSCRPDFAMLIYPAYLQDMEISIETPETFILQTLDDTPHTTGTEIYIERLKEKSIRYESHLFEKGGHGYGMRPTGNPVSEWPDLLKKWLIKLEII